MISSRETPPSENHPPEDIAFFSQVKHGSPRWYGTNLSTSPERFKIFFPARHCCMSGRSTLFSSSVGSGKGRSRRPSAAAGPLRWLKKSAAGSHFRTASTSAWGKSSEPRNSDPGGEPCRQDGNFERSARCDIRFV